MGTLDTIADTEVVTTTLPPSSSWPPVDTAGAPVQIWQGDSLERPSGMAIDSRGRLFVADRAQVFIVNPSGGLAGVLGRKGAGPGEFQAIRGLGVLPSDTVVVWDGTQQRLTWFSSDGKVARTRSASGVGQFTGARRISMVPSAKGVILAWGFDLVRPGGSPDSVALTYQEWRDVAPKVLAVIEDVSWVNGGQLLGSRYPFGARALYTVSRSGLFAVTTGVHYCITVGRITSRGVRRICREWARQPVGDASRMPDTTGVGSAGPGLVGVLSRQEFAARKNSIDEIAFDDQERLWVRVVDASHRSHPMFMSRLPRLRPRYYAWEVFDQSGRLAERVALPSHFRPLLFLSTSLFGVLEDESGDLNVARVDLHR